MASSKVEICQKNKNPPRAQIFRYFRIESRNNYLSRHIFLLEWEIGFESQAIWKTMKSPKFHCAQNRSKILKKR